MKIETMEERVSLYAARLVPSDYNGIGSRTGKCPLSDQAVKCVCCVHNQQTEAKKVAMMAGAFPRGVCQDEVHLIAKQISIHDA